MCVTVRMLACSLLIGAAGICAAGAQPATESPDLARALALRELVPVRTWLAANPDADSAEAWRVRVALARIDAPDQAGRWVADALDRHPDDAGLLLQQAAIELDAMDADDGRFERMRQARAVGRLLERVLELDPDHPEGLTAAIGFHREVPRIAGGRAERTGPWVERLEVVAPAQAEFVRYESAEQEGQLDDAGRALDRAIALDPLQRPEWRSRRAALEGQRGNVEPAIDALETLVEARPGYAPAWFELGRWSASSEHDPARGIEALERYVLMDRWPGDPSLARALVHLATLKTRAGDAEGARRALAQARILEPGLFEASDS